MQEFNSVAGTQRIIHVYVEDTRRSDGGGLTGLEWNTTDLEINYIKRGEAAITGITMTDTTVGTWISSGFKEVDATSLPGWYELQLPNACVRLGFGQCTLTIMGAANMAQTNIRLLEDQRRLSCRYPRGME